MYSRLLFLTTILISISVSRAAISNVAPVEGQFYTSLGRTRDAAQPDTSFTFEPMLAVNFNEKQSLSLYSAIDRSTDPREPFTIPKTMFTYRNTFAWLPETTTAWRVYLTALDLHRWGSDGYMVRTGFAGELSRVLLPGLTGSVRVGPFGQLSRYTQKTDGVDQPQYGISERFQLTYELGRFQADLLLALDQSFNGRWRNDFATTEQVSVWVHENMRFGLAHELLSSTIDDSTGFYRPLSLTGRESRFSGFADIIF